MSIGIQNQLSVGKNMKDEGKLTMPVMIDGKRESVPFHYEQQTGGRMIKVPDLDGDFHEATALGDDIPAFISARR